jgi:uncharacterized membrane protein
MADNDEVLDGSTRITSRTIYDRLGKMETKIDVLDERVTQHASWQATTSAKTAAQVQDIENRLRVVEAAIAKNAWLPALATAILTSVLVGVIVAALTN